MQIDTSDLSNLVAIDFETTGLSPSRDRIVELAMAGLGKSGKPVWTWQSLVNPGRPIPISATTIHGIDDRQVSNAPAFSELACAVAQLLEGKVLLAHNLRFDASFLRTEYRRIGHPMPADFGLDTLEMSRRIGRSGVSHRLEDLCERYGLIKTERHRALSDALAACQLLQVLMSSHPSEILLVKRL